MISQRQHLLQLSVMIVFSLTSCLSSREFHSQIEKLNERIMYLHRKIESIETKPLLSNKRKPPETMISCTEPVRNLLNDINAECGIQGQCSDEDIKVAVRAHDPNHTGRLDVIFKNFLNEPLYIDNQDISVLRELRLRRFLETERTSTGKYILLVRTLPIEYSSLPLKGYETINNIAAKNRSEIMVAVLKDFGIDPKRILVWTHNFNVSRGWVENHRPLQDEQNNTRNIAWLIYVDCEVN